jgi:GTPase SAR1 family protein
MPANIKSLLAEFVDRDSEINKFRVLLDEETLSILVVWGGGGVGKTSLMAKMIHETAVRKLRKSEIIWTDNRCHDYLAIMRKLRDDIGVDNFKPFTDLINYFTVPKYQLHIKLDGLGPISVGENSRIEGAQVGDIAGVIVKDLMLSEPREDMRIPEGERMTRLTDIFIQCLAAEATGEPLIVFMDSVEKMGKETERWVWGELLGAVRDGIIQNTKFVLCGRKEPQLDRSWNHLTEVRQLKPLEREHVIAYLNKRGVQKGVEQIADMLVITAKGNMLDLATYVDAYLKMVENRN